MPKNSEKRKAFKSSDLKASKLFGELAGTRTQDPYIKSVLLYQLSYQFIPGTRGESCFWECKNRVKRIGGKFLSEYFSTRIKWLSTFSFGFRKLIAFKPTPYSAWHSPHKQTQLSIYRLQ